MKKDFPKTAEEVVIPNRKAYPMNETGEKIGGISKPFLYDELIHTGKLKTFKIKKRRFASQNAIDECIELLEEESAA